jgi:hypothetical protein
MAAVSIAREDVASQLESFATFCPLDLTQPEFAAKLCRRRSDSRARSDDCTKDSGDAGHARHNQTAYTGIGEGTSKFGAGRSFVGGHATAIRLILIPSKFFDPLPVVRPPFTDLVPHALNQRRSIAKAF